LEAFPIPQKSQKHPKFDLAIASLPLGIPTNRVLSKNQKTRKKSLDSTDFL
jgi:hypothetical protein